jgi:hypothetical protein
MPSPSSRTAAEFGGSPIIEARGRALADQALGIDQAGLAASPLKQRVAERSTRESPAIPVSDQRLVVYRPTLRPRSSRIVVWLPLVLSRLITRPRAS